MPPKIKVTKEDILTAAVDIIRQGGEGQLNARSVAQALGVSTQPIFSNYKNMDVLRADVIAYADKLSNSYTEMEMSRDKYPKYKASGMAYIEFAKQEKELFKLLYMRDRRGEDIPCDFNTVYNVIDVIMAATGFDRDTAEFFHLEMWTFVHGIAVMFATSYLEIDMDTVSMMVTDVYQSLLERFKEKQNYIKELK